MRSEKRLAIRKPFDAADLRHFRLRLVARCQTGAGNSDKARGLSQKAAACRLNVVAGFVDHCVASITALTSSST